MINKIVKFKVLSLDLKYDVDFNNFNIYQLNYILQIERRILLLAK